MTQVAEAFGCPRSAQPADADAFRAYFDEQVRTIEVTDAGRRLARDVLDPTLPLRLHVPLGPALAVQRLVAVGTLPEPLREQFGFRWDADQQRRLDRVHRAARRLTARVPRPVRIAPGHAHGRLLLRAARKHVAAFEAKLADRDGDRAAA
jgi:uncharacterized protein (DUF2236 family)